MLNSPCQFWHKAPLVSKLYVSLLLKMDNGIPWYNFPEMPARALAALYRPNALLQPANADKGSLLFNDINSAGTAKGMRQVQHAGKTIFAGFRGD
jgi:hypothetical protein